MHVHLVTHPYASTHASTSEQRQVGVCCNQAACEREHAGGGSMFAHLCVLQKRHRITVSSVLVHGSSLWQHTQLRVVVLSPAFLPLSAPQHPWPKQAEKPGGSVCTNCLGYVECVPEAPLHFFFLILGACACVCQSICVCVCKQTSVQHHLLYR